MTFDLAALVRDYGDAAGEARACRASAALFDFSFVSSARLRGPAALDTLGKITRRRLDDLPPGRIRYAVRTDAQGYLQSDLTVWRHGADSFEVMSGRPEDIADFQDMAGDGVTVTASENAILAVQGPMSLDVLAAVCDAGAIAELPYYGFVLLPVAGFPALIGRLGYTGELGFEIILPRAAAAQVWRVLSVRVRPAGFAAADILRIEAGFVLFANEFRIPVTPAEAQLGLFAAVSEPPQGGLNLVTFTASADFTPVLWRPPVGLGRPAEPGHLAVTSVCFSPHADTVLGLGYMLRSGVDNRQPVSDPFGTFREIAIVQHPWIDPLKQRPRGGFPRRPRCFVHSPQRRTDR